MAAVYYPYYMKKKRKPKTREQILQADAIRQKLQDIAQQEGYGITYYKDSNGRDMARIGRTDGKGMGFMLSATQAHELLQT